MLKSTARTRRRPAEKQATVALSSALLAGWCRSVKMSKATALHTVLEVSFAVAVCTSSMHFKLVGLCCCMLHEISAS